MKAKTIPGIHNYCDRWCERCPFTNQCSVYKNPTPTSEETPLPPLHSLWKAMSEDPVHAIAVLEDAARVFGIDLEKLLQDARQLTDEVARAENTPKHHPLSLNSFDYNMRFLEWLASLDFRSDGTIDENGWPMSRPAIREELEIITWNSSCIHAKLRRAVTSVVTIDEWAQETGLQKDSDGSAKVALIAIKTSIKAWQKLYAEMPQYEDDILRFLVCLQQLRKATLDAFPDAMNFIRPGFDE